MIIFLLLIPQEKFMSSPMIESILLCKKKKFRPNTALAVVAVMMCGRDLSTHEELFYYCDKWVEEFGAPTYKKILSFAKDLGYMREISEISLNLDWKEKPDGKPDGFV